MIEGGLIAARWLHYAAVTILFGLAFFPIHAPWTPLTADDRRHRTMAASAAVTVLSGLAWFFFSTASMAGDMASALPTIPTVFFETDFGPIWAVRLLVALALCAEPLRRTRRTQAVLAGLLLASLALTGHGHMNHGFLGWVHSANDAVHLLAAGAWLGALSAFLLLLRSAPQDPRTGRALSDFSTTGSIAVAAIVASGVGNACFTLGSLTPLFSTLYGRLLLLKVGLFAGMVILAAFNRFRLVPAFKAMPGSAAVHRLRAHIVGEQLLGMVVLLIVAAIGTLDSAV